MADPQTWPHTPTAGDADGPPRMRWVRWLISGLTLLTVAFIFHTSGRVARHMVIATRHWMTTSFHLPKGTLNHVPVALQRLLSDSSRVHKPLALSSRDWIAPVNGAQVHTSFGWHGSGSEAQFESGVVLAVTRHSPVLSGISGVVSAETSNQLTVHAADGYTVSIGPLSAMTTRLHQHISPTDIVGKTAGTVLTIDVTRDNYPVNPLSPTLYGTRWLRH